MMDQAGKHTNHFSGIAGQNISYYDEIAASYDSILDSDPANERIRQQVARKMTEAVNEGRVLDFGGGTGKDLGWLSRHRYDIVFCEPSAEMRERAIAFNNSMVHNHRVYFLEGAATDFSSWQQALPFAEKMDAILSNFAVFNSIADIGLLFKNLALAAKPGAHLIALVLRYDARKMLKTRPANAVRSFISGKPATMQVQYKTHLQTVFLHTPGQIKKAAGLWFDLRNNEPVEDSCFSLLHFTRR
jgi:SAM-dependent methyltransferase